MNPSANPPNTLRHLADLSAIRHAPYIRTLAAETSGVPAIEPPTTLLADRHPAGGGGGRSPDALRGQGGWR